MKTTISAFLLLVQFVSAKPFESPEKVKSEIRRACRDANFSPNIMLAICERESAFGVTLDKNWRGDRGFGYGVCQLDIRYHADFLNNNNWKSSYVSCKYAIKLIKSNMRAFGGKIQPAIAAYNCGVGGVRKAAHYDGRTTGKNYARDVLNRARYVANK